MRATLETVLEKYPNAERDALIPILQEVQEVEGYLSRESIIRIGRHLKLPASKVHGVATFYNQFRFERQGRFHVQLCRGTACHVKGSAAVLEAVKRTLGINPGATSRDGKFSLEIVACMGACGLAPVISINGEFFAGMTPEGTEELLADYRKKAEDEKSN
jgi:NADH-quinone oxidoreductase E subunit